MTRALTDEELTRIKYPDKIDEYKKVHYEFLFPHLQQLLHEVAEEQIIAPGTSIKDSIDAKVEEAQQV